MTPSEQEPVDAPRPCCLRIIDASDDAERGDALRRSFEPGRGLYHCGECGRDFALAKLYVDDSCIEALDYEFYRVVDMTERDALFARGTAPHAASEKPGASFDLAEYIMNQRPYFARNRAAGGAFQRVE